MTRHYARDRRRRFAAAAVLEDERVPNITVAGTVPVPSAFCRCVLGLSYGTRRVPTTISGTGTMRRTLLKSKIHRATVTEADLHYEGSITVDPELLEAADILHHEQVDVLNITNGARLTTYTIPGPRGTGEICINGAAAHLVSPGDMVIIVSYADFHESELADYEPRVILVGQDNQALRRSWAVNAK